MVALRIQKLHFLQRYFKLGNTYLHLLVTAILVSSAIYSRKVELILLLPLAALLLYFSLRSHRTYIFQIQNKRDVVELCYLSWNRKKAISIRKEHLRIHTRAGFKLDSVCITFENTDTKFKLTQCESGAWTKERIAELLQTLS